MELFVSHTLCIGAAARSAWIYGRPAENLRRLDLRFELAQLLQLHVQDLYVHR